MLDHVLLFTADGGNIDGLHPVQLVLDLLNGPNRDFYAKKVEEWFKNYMGLRGLPFKPLAECVTDPVSY